MKKFLILLVLLFAAAGVSAQTVAPIGALGSIQFLDNSGVPLTNGVLYSYQAGTTTQQATFTDSSGTVQNTNPVAFGSGGRAQIWLSVGSFYKFVLCLQNDGPFCAAGDILFTVDQVPGGSTSSGGGSSPFTGTFISGTASPATSGILRLASADTVCFRNAAGSANLCFSKDGNDLLSWAGGSLKFPEVGAPTGVAGFDLLWADNTAHRWKMANNGGTAAQVVGSGVDINTSDQVTQLHFGAAAAPLSSTAPATNQILQWNGTNIIWQIYASPVDLTGQTTNCATQTLLTPAASGFYFVDVYLVITTRAGTSSTTPTVQVNWTDSDSSTAENFPVVGSTLNAVGIITTTNSPIFVKAGTAITVSCSGYASNPANVMTYALRVRMQGPL